MTATLAYPVGRHMSASHRGFRIGFIVLFGAMIATNIVACGMAESGQALSLHLLGAAFSGYLLLESLHYIGRSDAFGLVSPVLLANVFVFAFAYLLGPTATLFDPFILDRLEPFVHGDMDAAAAGVLVIAMLAAFAMWRGYGVGKAAAAGLRRAAAQAAPTLRSRLELNWPVVLGVEIGHLVLIYAAVGLGVYGLTATMEGSEQYLSLLAILNIGISAGTLSFFLIAIYYFSERAEGRARVGFTAFFSTLLVLHIFTGALSAFKSQIVMPFLIAAVASFIANRRISVKYLLFAIFALYAAYQTVEPYRAYLDNTNNRPSDIASLVAGYREAIDHRTLYMDDGSAPLMRQIISRFDLVGMSAVVLEYSDAGYADGAIRSQIRDSMLLSPILAFVPRFIWEDKHSYSTGRWFATSVLGRPTTSVTSIAMGPIGFLYIGGGVLGVVLGFFAIGALQAVMFEGLARSGVGGFIIYLGAASFLFNIPTDIGPAFTGFLRMLPIAFGAQFVLLSTGRRLGHRRAATGTSRPATKSSPTQREHH